MRFSLWAIFSMTTTREAPRRKCDDVFYSFQNKEHFHFLSTWHVQEKYSRAIFTTKKYTNSAAYCIAALRRCFECHPARHCSAKPEQFLILLSSCEAWFGSWLCNVIRAVSYNARKTQLHSLTSVSKESTPFETIMIVFEVNCHQRDIDVFQVGTYIRGHQITSYWMRWCQTKYTHLVHNPQHGLLAS